MSTETDIRFRPLGKYDWPSTSVDHGLDRLRTSIMKRFQDSKNASGISFDRLDPAVIDLLDRVAATPSNRPLMAELTATLADWMGDEAPAQTLQTIILPPCDREDFLTQWAGDQGLDLFDSDGAPSELEALDDPAAPLLVIPRLEDRFLRTPEGLIRIRQLIGQLSRFRRKAVIGCNSWAWQFLIKSCEIDLVLSDPIMFQAFDRTRLRNWLGGLALGRPASELGEDALCFRAVSSGKDVFGNGEDEAEISSYMTDLAKRSLGIPWVAWHLWRASLYLEKPPTADEIEDDKSEGAAAAKSTPKATMSEMDTVWVAGLRSLVLPSRSDQNALLVLHALLLHGGLTRDDIQRTVPLIAYTNVLSSLLRAGLIDKIDDVYRCIPAAYPAIRDGLKNNGYPMDVL